MEHLYKQGNAEKPVSLFSKKRHLAQEKLVKNLANMFTKTFHFNIRSENIDETIEDMRKNLPFDNENLLSKNKNLLKNICDTIGMQINKTFEKEVIEPKDDVVDYCKELSSKIHTLIKSLYKENQDMIYESSGTIKTESKKILAQNKFDMNKISKEIKKYFKNYDGEHNKGMAKIFDAIYQLSNAIHTNNQLSKNLRLAGVKKQKPDEKQGGSKPMKHSELPQVKDMHDVFHQRVNFFVKRLRERMNNLSDGIRELIIDFAKGVKIPGNFYEVISAFGNDLSILRYKTIYGLIGISKKTGALSRSIKFLDNIRNLEAVSKFILQNNPHLRSAKNTYEAAKSVRVLCEETPVTFKLKKILPKNLVEGGDIFETISNTAHAIKEGTKTVISKIGETAKNVATTADNLLTNKTGSGDYIDYLNDGNSEAISIPSAHIRDKLMFLYRRQQMLGRFKGLYQDALKTNTLYEKVNGENVSLLIEQINKDYGHGKWRIQRGYRGDNAGVTMLAFDGGLMGRIRACFRTAKPEVQEELIQAKYNCLINLVKSAEALDLYYQNFVLETLKNPEAIKPLLLEMQSALYAVNQTNPVVAAAHRLKISNRAFRNKGVIAPGGPIGAPPVIIGNTNVPREVPLTESYLPTRYSKIKRAIEESTYISQLITIFSKMAELTGNAHLFEKTFMTPVEIYENIVKYLAFKDILHKRKKSRPQNQPSAFHIKKGRNITFMHKIYKEKHGNTNFDYLLADMINSMYGHILVCVDLYNLMNKNSPFSIGYIHSPARIILGAKEDDSSDESDETDENENNEVEEDGPSDYSKESEDYEQITGSKEIVPSNDVFETYIRVPLLIQFYKAIFDRKISKRKYTETLPAGAIVGPGGAVALVIPPGAVGIAPGLAPRVLPPGAIVPPGGAVAHFATETEKNETLFNMSTDSEDMHKIFANVALDDGFGALYKACYSTVISSRDVETIVEYCNILHNEYRKDDDPCFSVMNKIAEDVSSKIGLMNRKKFEHQMEDIVLTNNSDLMRVEKTRKDAPSDKFGIKEIVFKNSAKFDKYYRKTGQKLYRVFRDINRQIKKIIAHNLDFTDQYSKLSMFTNFISSRKKFFVNLSNEKKMEAIAQILNGGTWTDTDIFKKIGKFELYKLPLGLARWNWRAMRHILACLGPVARKFRNAGGRRLIRRNDRKKLSFSLLSNEFDDYLKTGGRNAAVNNAGLQTMLRHHFPEFCQYLIEVVRCRTDSQRIPILNSKYPENKALTAYLLSSDVVPIAGAKEGGVDSDEESVELEERDSVDFSFEEDNATVIKLKSGNPAFSGKANWWEERGSIYQVDAENEEGYTLAVYELIKAFKNKSLSTETAETQVIAEFCNYMDNRVSSGDLNAGSYCLSANLDVADGPEETDKFDKKPTSNNLVIVKEKDGKQEYHVTQEPVMRISSININKLCAALWNKMPEEQKEKSPLKEFAKEHNKITVNRKIMEGARNIIEKYDIDDPKLQQAIDKYITENNAGKLKSEVSEIINEQKIYSRKNIKDNTTLENWTKKIKESITIDELRKQIKKIREIARIWKMKFESRKSLSEFNEKDIQRDQKIEEFFEFIISELNSASSRYSEASEDELEEIKNDLKELLERMNIEITKILVSEKGEFDKSNLNLPIKTKTTHFSELIVFPSKTEVKTHRDLKHFLQKHNLKNLVGKPLQTILENSSFKELTAKLGSEFTIDINLLKASVEGEKRTFENKINSVKSFLNTYNEISETSIDKKDFKAIEKVLDESYSAFLSHIDKNKIELDRNAIMNDIAIKKFQQDYHTVFNKKYPVTKMIEKLKDTERLNKWTSATKLYSHDLKSLAEKVGSAEISGGATSITKKRRPYRRVVRWFNDMMVDNLANAFVYKGKIYDFQQELGRLLRYVHRFDAARIRYPDFYEVLYSLNHAGRLHINPKKYGPHRLELNEFHKLLQTIHNHKSAFSQTGAWEAYVSQLSRMVRSAETKFSERFSRRMTHWIEAHRPFRVASKRYFKTFKMHDFERQFRQLTGEFLKKTSIKANTKPAELRYYYAKTIEPLANGYLSFSLTENKGNNILDKRQYSTLRRSVIQEVDNKIGKSPYLISTFELLTSGHKNKISRHIYDLQLKFEDIHRKAQYFKNWFMYWKKSDKKQMSINDILGKSLLILGLIKETIKMLNEEPIHGEIDVGFYENLSRMTADKPIAPIGAVFSVINRRDSSDLLYAARAVFKVGADGGKFNPVAFPGFMQLAENFNASSANKLSREAIIELGEVSCKLISKTYQMFHQPSWSGLRAFALVPPNYYNDTRDLNRMRISVYEGNPPVMRRHPTDRIGNTAAANVERFKPNKLKEILTSPSMQESSLDYYNLLTNNNNGPKHSHKNLLTANIIEKNFMPLNIRSMFKTVIFPNNQIFSVIGRMRSGHKRRSILEATYTRKIGKAFRRYVREMASETRRTALSLVKYFHTDMDKAIVNEKQRLRTVHQNEFDLAKY